MLVGNTYKCFPGRAALVVADPDQLDAHGIVHPAKRCPAWSDRVLRRRPRRAHPPPDRGAVPLPRLCGTTHQHDFADAVYYTTPSGAGVFESGTQDWVCGMDPYCTGPAQTGHVAPILDAISTRLFTTFAAGPAGHAHPAIDNLARLGIKPGAHAVAAPDLD